MNEDFIRLLLSRYESAEERLLEIMAGYIREDIDQDTWTAMKLAQIQRLKKDTVAVLLQLKDLDQDAKTALIQAYLSSAGNRTPGLIQTNDAALQKLVADYLKQLSAARFQILRQMDDTYRSIIASVAEMSTLGIETRVTTARRALDKFAAEGITAFYSKDGRRMDIQGYVSMATRTALNNALREGKAAGLVAAGKDLIIVRTSPRYCPLCEPFKNTILSLSGRSSEHQSLAYAKSKGLYHPNCRCSFSLYVPGITEVKDKDKIENNYDAEEKQRQLERSIRVNKRRLAVDVDNQRAKTKIREKQKELRELVAAEDLNRKRNRESIAAAR